MEHDLELGYKMGVYLCLGQSIHNMNFNEAETIYNYKSSEEIQEKLNREGRIFLFLGEGQHKIKRKAEQEACFEALKYLNDILPETK
jgi:hypothetical protein